MTEVEVYKRYVVLLRYLLVNRKISRAKETLETIARVNGKPLCDINLKIPEENASARKKHNYLDLLKEWRILLVTLAIAFQWLSTSLAYYALSLEAGSMGGDLYKTFAFVQCADLPSFLTSAILSDRFGRKRTYLLSKLTAGILVGLLAVVPQYLSARYTINITLAVVAKFFTENALNVLYAWSSEIFPTVLRGEGVSVCVVFQRLGMLAVPFLTTLLQRVHYVLPFVFICVLALLACGVALVLPETNKKATRETYEDFFDNVNVIDRSYERID